MPKLLVTLPDSGEVAHDLAEPVVTVGRLDDNALHIDDPSVSSRHAQLTLQETGHYLLRDLNSTNGTRVNGERITEVTLRPGDLVRFGKIDAVYESTVPADGSDVPVGGEDVPVPHLAGTPGPAGESVTAPVAATPAAEVAARSHRPADFANAAPFKKQGRTRDPLGRAIMIFALVSFLLFLVALFYVFRLQPPGGLPA